MNGLMFVQTFCFRKIRNFCKTEVWSEKIMEVNEISKRPYNKMMRLIGEIMTFTIELHPVYVYNKAKKLKGLSRKQKLYFLKVFNL